MWLTAGHFQAVFWVAVIPAFLSAAVLISRSASRNAQQAPERFARRSAWPPGALRGTAYGIFNLLSGLALLLASVLAGALWDIVGPQGTFLVGAAFTAVALADLAATRRFAPGAGQTKQTQPASRVRTQLIQNAAIAAIWTAAS